MPITRLAGAPVARGQGQFVSVPYGWDTGYKAAQAALSQSGTPIRVWIVGDSIVAGYKATNVTTECFRWLVRNALVNKFGRSADYFGVTLSQHYSDFGGIGTSAYTLTNNPPWLLQTSPATAAPYGFLNGTSRVGYVGGSPTAVTLAYSGTGGDCTWINPGAGQTIATFQHSVATWLETCQAYDLVCPNLTAGTPMSYNTNGAGATNVTLTSDARIQVIQMATGLTAGRYDTVIKGVGASGQPWLSGVTAHATTRGAAGVQVAHLGVNAAILGSMDSNYVDKFLLGRDAATGTVGNGGFPMCPDLVVCNFIMSDAGLYSPDMSALSLAQFVEGLRRARSNVSVIFVCSYRPNGVTTDGAAFDSFAQNASTYIEAQLSVAQQLGCAFVNVHDAFQGKAVANGYTQAGEIHPTTAGHLAYYNLIAPLL